ncbi:ThiF family adenylyltransferase [Leptospira kmetyi]|uniref:ThiF family adenylyltransferase n=1 Tax=Leptospira kmetyi TaxID=408139 RepID=UPI0010844D09|nr:ThiF family adenylyltransferase [Leptospira kmetyi]TGK23372.1 hypothetical protein EHO62_00015 [Leptospira kmetyi]TGK34410.1 hypothetical protein EHO66_00600 [Leptospira kmetyi]
MEETQYWELNNCGPVNFALRFEITKKLLEAIQRSLDFEFIETQCLSEKAEAIIVDYINTSIRSRNKIGIKNRERLAIAFIKGAKTPLEVIPLRKDFPNVLHLNNFDKDYPRSLCLYLESWNETERNYTPEKFLKRIGWWLFESSKNTLHVFDQPLEQLFFNTKYEILIPHNFREYSKDLNKIMYRKKVIQNEELDTFTLEVEFRNKIQNDPEMNFLCVTIQPVKHTSINYHPPTLGELQDQFVDQSSDLIEPLRSEFKRVVPNKGIVDANHSDYSVLILTIPRLGLFDEITDRIDIYAVIIDSKLGSLGESMGVLHRQESEVYYVDHPILGEGTYKEDWRDITIYPIQVAYSPTKEFARRVSDIDSNSAEFESVLIGAGSLGSSMADLWAKEAWGNWTVVDGDQIKTHNIIRHSATLSDFGKSKAKLVAEKMNENYEQGYAKHTSICIEISQDNQSVWLSKFQNSNFIVDATASTGVARDISNIDSLSRCSSVFLTPSGSGGVLWLEDLDRNIRLDYLELLFYRAIITENWGESFLLKERPDLRIGEGCRDLSFVISYEQIKLYSSLFARQLRLNKEKPEAILKVWVLDDNSGAISVNSLDISNPLSTTLDDWRIICDDWFLDKLKYLRSNNLPNETGGPLIGYFDQKLKKIYIVDTINAPSDSESSSTSFVRGVEGLKEEVTAIIKKSSGNLNYIGEWHSHPKNVNVRPSPTDLFLLSEFTTIMSQEGLPFIMLIVGDEDKVSFSLGLG